ncbi:MAG: pyruvate kinase [Candidatus Buchananbacteria bacterium]|jgi:pyruvate kinase
MIKRTKVVATIGPASESKTMMLDMMKAGMNVARLNFSHGTHEHHAKLIKNLRSAAKTSGTTLAIIQDLQGPRIRIGEVAKDGIELKHGQEVILVNENFKITKKSAVTYLPIQYPQLYHDLSVGAVVLIDDASIELKVLSIKNKAIKCSVVTPGIIKTHKGMNFPKSLIKCPPVTAKDMKDVEFGVQRGVDYIALSFVKDEKDVNNLRRRLLKLEKKYLNLEQGDFGKADKPASKGKISGEHIRIIAKIERREAVENFDKILEASDGIMVARGDLGIEMPLEELPMLQKSMIEKCRMVGKPVIVATQMLESMIKSPLPTRAEVSDVANAVLDGTDGIMLSGESASGKYPLKAVQYMSKISRHMEQEEIVEQEAREGLFKNSKSITQVISFIAQDLAEDTAGARIIVCATTSGFTARNISRFRPAVPIIAVTPSALTRNQLALSWGVQPHIVKFTDSFNYLLSSIKKLVLKERLAKKGDQVVVVAGHPFGYKGQSNLIKVDVM